MNSPTIYRSQRIITAWEQMAVMLICLDALTTTFALFALPAAVEANPVVASVIAQIGIVPTMFGKILVGSAFAMFLAYSAEHGYPFRWMHRTWRLRRTTRSATCRRAYWMLVTLTALHGFVVINNLIVIFLNT